MNIWLDVVVYIVYMLSSATDKCVGILANWIKKMSCQSILMEHWPYGSVNHWIFISMITTLSSLVQCVF